MAPVDLFYKQTRFMKGKQPQRSNGQQQASLCGDLILDSCKKMTLVSIRLNLFTCPNLEQESYKVNNGGDLQSHASCSCRCTVATCRRLSYANCRFVAMCPNCDILYIFLSLGFMPLSRLNYGWLFSRVMSACFDRKISFAGCNSIAGVPCGCRFQAINRPTVVVAK
ncbi:Pyridoxine 5'-phosphate synthase [Trichinella pseudospiralis]